VTKKDKYISQRDLSKIYKKEAKSLSGFLKETGDIRKSVFLSHSHLDKTIVAKVSTLLKSLNADIYIDWLDNSMPEETNATTAQIISEKIGKCNKFLFLATSRGLRSKWCTWELGIADAMKGRSNLAILPIESNYGNWNGREYLNLYSEMKFDETNLDAVGETQVYIQTKENKSIGLRDWLFMK
jgi:hypothetical protein